MRSASIGSPAECPRLQYIDAQPNGSSSGFTLFETLTAMLVLSIALVSLFEAHSRALRTSRIATNYAQARILGESLLAKAVSGWNGKLRSEKGVSNGFAWSVEIAPETASWAKIETKNNWRLRHVRVRVGLGDGREIKLDTLKLGRSNG